MTDLQSTVLRQQAASYADYFRTECGHEGEATFTYATRPSRVVDLFTGNEEGRFVIGYVTRTGAFIETGCGAEEMPCEYWDVAELSDEIWTA